MTFTGGSWRFEYSVSREELMAGTELLARYQSSRRQVRPRPSGRIARIVLTWSLLFVPLLVFIAFTYVDDFLRCLKGEWQTSLIDGVTPSMTAIAGAVLLALLMIKPRGSALPAPVIRQVEHDVYHITATSDATALRSYAEGMTVDLDARDLQDIVDLDGWLLIMHRAGPILLPRRIFPNDETAERYIAFIRSLIRRRWSNPWRSAQQAAG